LTDFFEQDDFGMEEAPTLQKGFALTVDHVLVAVLGFTIGLIFGTLLGALIPILIQRGF
jgi:hypothetical protein